MSSYTVSAVTVTAIPRPTEAELLEASLTDLIGTADEWVGSQQLQALADRLPAALADRDASSLGPSAIAAERFRELSSNPMARTLVGNAAGDVFSGASKLLEESSAVQHQGDAEQAKALATSADRMLRSALSTAANRRRVYERHLVADRFDNALRRAGFTVSVERGRRCTGLWASRGDAVLAMLVQDGGLTEADWAGCAGDACRPAMREVIEAAAAEGLECHVARAEHHGDDRGGQLIARTIAAGGGADGVVAQHEHGVPVQQEPQSADAVRRTRARS